MNSVLISVVIPCYNHGLYIEEAVESVENAKDKYPVEIIIVNDGSIDDHTISVFKKLEARGYFVLHQKNGGLGNARNNGIKLAKGKYILPLDSDNKVLYPYLNDAVDILEKNMGIDIVYGNANYLGNLNGVWYNKCFSLISLMNSNYIDACAIYKKSVWEQVNGYDENMPYNGIEDWDFWLSAGFKNCQFFYLEKSCFEYRVLSNSMIRQIDERKSAELDRYLRSKFGMEYYNYFNYYYNRYFYFVEIPLYKSIPKIILYKLGIYKYKNLVLKNIVF